MDPSPVYPVTSPQAVPVRVDAESFRSDDERVAPCTELSIERQAHYDR